MHKHANKNDHAHVNSVSKAQKIFLCAWKIHFFYIIIIIILCCHFEKINEINIYR